MRDNEYSIKEIKVTAMVYATRDYLVDLVKSTGRLPKSIPHPGGFIVPLRVLIERRGIDPILTDDEKLVFEAILREKRLPGGCARLTGI